MCNCNKSNIVLSSNGYKAKQVVVDDPPKCSEVQCGLRQTDILQFSRQASIKYKSTRSRDYLEINRFFSMIMTEMYSNCDTICTNIDKINENVSKLQ